MKKPLVVAIEMGYGHLRAADPLARAFGVEVLHADRPPLADADEQRQWGEARRFYELGSRLSQLPGIGAPLRAGLDALTSIPKLYPIRDLSAPTATARAVERFAQRGLGHGLTDRLQRTGESLVTTFFTPAVIAARQGCERVFCVVTDSDINRVWAPFDPKKSRVTYFAPSTRVMRRLIAYGVPPQNIELTGFPLPEELLGGPELPALKRNLAARLVRLDPAKSFRAQFRDELHHFFGPLPEEEETRPPRVTFAIGGAGAQVGLVREFLPHFAGPLHQRRMRLTLVAGVRPEVEAALREEVQHAQLETVVEVLHAKDFETYFRRFNALLAETDVLWTKPSEMTFYAALGLPLVLAPPMGVHERYNRRWAREAGAGLKQRDARWAAEWISDWLVDGTLAAAAWNGYMRLPKHGLYRIVETVRAAESDRRQQERRG
jgi:hypothetical protein